MALKHAWRARARPITRSLASQGQYRCLACSIRHAQQQSPQTPRDEPTTHFGFETVPESVKEARGMCPTNRPHTAKADLSLPVGAVFSSVASSYDTMNDVMSLGIHRLWKDYFVRSINPGMPSFTTSTSIGTSSSSSRGWNMLDIAGGTGDIAFRLLDHATRIHNDTQSRVTVADINPDMLTAGRARSLSTPYAPPSPRLSFLPANAEALPADTIPSASVDLYTVAFGIRNFTNKAAALREAFRVLKPGGVFACLEFGKVGNPLLEQAYKRWSFGAIPLLGQLVAADRDSYQYLVESIERFPGQPEFARMIDAAGFVLPSEGWEDLTGGIAAIHKGVKPLEGGR